MREELEHARARGANSYGEGAGYGMSGDAYHMTQPAENGDGARRCMVNALRDGGINTEETCYRDLYELKKKRAHPMSIPKMMGNAAAINSAILILKFPTHGVT